MGLHSNTQWVAMVRSMLFDGFGADDIAVRSQSCAEAVRDEIALLRAEGHLEPLYAASRALAASQFKHSMQSVASLAFRNME